MMNETVNEMKILYVFDVEYCWIDGYDNWHMESIRVIAEDEDHALELATSRAYMPYGVNGVECLGAVSTFETEV